MRNSYLTRAVKIAVIVKIILIFMKITLIMILMCMMFPMQTNMHAASNR